MGEKKKNYFKSNHKASQLPSTLNPDSQCQKKVPDLKLIDHCIWDMDYVLILFSFDYSKLGILEIAYALLVLL